MRESVLVKIQAFTMMAVMESMTEPVFISMTWESVSSKASGL